MDRIPQIFNFQYSILHGVQAGEFQSCCFFETAHHVHGVDGLAGGAFHEVVDGGDDDQTRTGQLEANVTIIGAGQYLGFRVAINPLPFFDDSDERLLAINLAVGLPDVFFGCALTDKKMGRYQDTPNHFDGCG